jgi:hypothetical protein
MEESEDILPDAPLGQSLILLSTFIRQCNSQYLSTMCYVPAPCGPIYSVFADEGDVCIARSALPQAQLPEFENIVGITADEDDSDSSTLQKLTNHLKEVTAAACNLTITNLQLRWGIRSSQLPYLLGCQVFDFTTECDFPDRMAEILLFLALEISIVTIPGQCITPEKVCIGADHSILRSKVAIHRIRKFFDGVVTGDALDRLISYIIGKLREVMPDLTLRHVPCCVNCFRMYSVTSATSLTSSPVQMGKGSNGTPKRPKTRPAGIWKFAKPKKTDSQLLYVQDTSTRSCQQAFPLYLSDPFPPFFQHT